MGIKPVLLYKDFWKDVIQLIVKNILIMQYKVRESLGLCPQHNMLFHDLTVR